MHRHLCSGLSMVSLLIFWSYAILLLYYVIWYRVGVM